MEITRAHKIRLDPTREQERIFSQAAGNAWFVYNRVLGEWRRQYAEHKAGERETSPRVPVLMRELNAVKAAEYPWLLLSPPAVEDACLHVKDAFDRFFERQGRYPRFKSKRRSRRCFTASRRAREVRVEGRRIKLGGFGWIRMREQVRFEGVVKRVVVSEEAGRWFAGVSVTGEVDPTHYANAGGSENQAMAVGGVDAGLRTLATESDGTKHENPRALRNAQRRLSRRQKGSANREKARKRVACLHYRVKTVRENAVHNATTAIVRKYDVIGVESLNVKGMARNRRLALSVSDAAMSEALRQLKYKSDWAGKRIVEADRFYPSSKTCSACGNINEDLALRDERWTCPRCGAPHDRDVNAAVNLRKYAAQAATAIDAGSNACGEDGAGLWKACFPR